MSIPVPLKNLVVEGYEAWLRDSDLVAGEGAVQRFARLMTEDGRQTYEGLDRDQVEYVLRKIG